MRLIKGLKNLIKSGDACKVSCIKKTASLVGFQYGASESIFACTVSAKISTQTVNFEAVRLLLIDYSRKYALACVEIKILVSASVSSMLVQIEHMLRSC